MSTTIPPVTGNSETRAMSTSHSTNGTRTERRSTETKSAFKTTEFMAYIAVLAGILVAGLLVDDGSGAFGAEKAWLFATILTVGYMVSRGLAKAGSRDPYTYTHDSDSR